MAKKSGVDKMEIGKKVIINVDVKDAEVLEYDAGGALLVWDPYQFRRLDDSIVVQLTEGSRENYYKAKIQADERAVEAEKIRQADLEVMSPLAMNSSYRLKIRSRKGWHQCWKSPGVDFDSAMAGPYRQVRKSKDGDTDEAGQETGEVLKLLDGDGKVELIAVECPLEMYDQHLEAMARKSSRMLTGAKEEFFRAAEEINSKQTSRGARIVATDESMLQ